MRISFPSIAHIYRDPRDKQELRESTSGWIALDGRKYPTTSAYGQSIPIFTDLDTEYASASDAMYNTRQAAEVYRNFLNWLFATFEVDEASFRQSLVSKLHLKPGDRLLITGCGLGDDVIPVVNTFGPEVQVFALDLSTAMVSHAAEALGNLGVLRNGVVNLSVADACELPFADGTFDAVFHFGGINLFSDPKRGIFEMTRVVKEGGRVVFGDEGVAPWLKGTHYARMVIANNPLWEADSLISQLPFSAVNVNIRQLLLLDRVRQTS
jgi:SAM-dependent methyltransferase